MPTTAAPQDMLDAVLSARETRTAVGPLAASSGSSAEWAEALGALRSLVDVATAREDEVLVRLAALEPMVLDDGELVERHRAPGHVSLDAPAVVSGVLHLSPQAAESRVRDAVRRAADGPEGSPSCTGLGGLHRAMASGALDAHRAHVVAGSSRRHRPTSPARSSTPSHRGSSGRTRAGCGAGSVASSPASPPTCSGSERSASVRPPRCGAGPTSPGSTPGSAPSPPRRRARPGPPSTTSRSATWPTAPAPRSTGPGPRR